MIRTAACLLLLGIAGCHGSPGTGTRAAATAGARTFDGSYPLHAVATVGMVADAVRQVGGQHGSVTQIMGSGVDPHLYKMTRDDVQTILDGDILFCVGLMLEGKMMDALNRIASRQPVVAVGERLDAAQLVQPPGHTGQYDPHVWMDASLWSEAVEAIAAALSDFDPQHAEDYRDNAAAYREQIAELHGFGLRSIGSIPPDRRVLITSHDAFQYFGRAYGLDVQGVQGLSTESEAGLQRINELVDLIVRRQVPAVFVESSISPKNIEALIAGARARGHVLTIGGELFSDAMGEAGTYEGTYVGMLDHNITTVTRALGGDAPERGMQGRLGSGG